MSRSRRERSFEADLEGASNVLLLVPSMDASGEEVCARLLSAEEPHDIDYLSVTLTQSPDERLETFRQYATGSPDKVGVVAIDESTRSAAAAGGTGGPGNGAVTVESVSDPADLTGLGIEITRFLSEWEGDGNELRLCLHSLTTLLQYVDVQRLFRFLHVLTGRISAVEGVAHYHLDPEAHDEQTVNTILGLFDAVVERDDGEWQVRTR